MLLYSQKLQLPLYHHISFRLLSPRSQQEQVEVARAVITLAKESTNMKHISSRATLEVPSFLPFGSQRRRRFGSTQEKVRPHQLVRALGGCNGGAPWWENGSSNQRRDKPL